ncbi:MAG TPA: peptidoglycan-binding domain-containing protein [Chthoniobacterales bacterium]|nr:peptidoglycan-binding domain-containing protein [Chthoniobacterales bacterium]
MKRILASVVTGALLTGSLMAASGNDQARTRTKVRAGKSTATTTVSTRANRNVRTQRVVTSGNPRYVGTTGAPVQTRNRVVTRYNSYPSYGYRSYGYSGYPSYGYGYGYPSYGYGGGYGYGPSISFGFGSPSYGSYYPYDSYSYANNYNYGAYYYNQPSYGYGRGSIVITVQSRLARMGYYRGPIDGVMGRGTSWAIRAYERDHGLRMDGTISGPLVRSLGLRY